MKRNQQLWGARPCGRAHYCGCISWGVDGVTRGAESSGRGAQVSKTFFFSRPSPDLPFLIGDSVSCLRGGKKKKKRKKRFPRRAGLFPPWISTPAHATACLDLLTRCSNFALQMFSTQSDLQSYFRDSIWEMTATLTSVDVSFWLTVTANLFLNHELDCSH